MNALPAPWDSLVDRVLAYAGTQALQVAVLVVILLAIEALGRRRLRPVVRHGLWLLVPLKLLLPPSLALPSGPAYWMPASIPSIAHGNSGALSSTPPNVPEAFHPEGPGNSPVDRSPLPSANRSLPSDSPASPVPHRLATSSASPEPQPDATVRPEKAPLALLAPAALATWLLGAAALFVGLLQRTRQLHRLTREATTAPAELHEVLRETARQIGLRRPIDLKLVGDGSSPALCGLRHPVILLPRGLSLRLTPAQLRAVLLHELSHARRADIAVNAVQTLLQVIWWWHPFVWLANARLRAAREETVDDTVAFELGPDDDSYPSALLEVARTALSRPALTLGLIGIFESRSALRSRIERLLESPPSRPPRLGLAGLAALATTALILIPMARGTVDRESAPSQGEAATGTASPGTHALIGAPLREGFSPDRDSGPANSPIAATTAATRAGVSDSDPKPAGITLEPPVPATRDELWASTTTFEYRPNFESPGNLTRHRLETTLTRTIDPWGHEVAFDAPPGRPITDDWATPEVGNDEFRRVDGSLVTRVFPLAVPGTNTNSGADSGRLHLSVRDQLQSLSRGFETFFFTEISRLLMARGTAVQIAALEQGLIRSGLTPYRIAVEARLYLLPGDGAPDLGLTLKTNPPASSSIPAPWIVNSAGTNILDPSQRNALLSAIPQQPDVELLGGPRAWVSEPGRRETIELTTVSSNNPVSLTLDCGPLVPGSNSVEFPVVVRTTTVVRMTPGKPTDGNSRGDEASGSGIYSVNATGYINQVRTNLVTLADDHAVLLAGTALPEIVRTHDEVPVLADVPLLGRLFRSDGSFTRQRQQVLVLTVHRYAAAPASAGPTVLSPLRTNGPAGSRP